MAQDLTVNIKTTSDVPQAMDKARAATSSFDKQVDDISKKFKNAFKDIFLGFVAPMIIVQKVLSSITEAYQSAKQLSKEALDFGSEATNKYVNEQESAIRRLIKLREEDNKSKMLSEKGTREAYADILMNTPEGQEIYKRNRKFGQGFRPYQEGDIYKGFDTIAAEEMSKSPKIRAEIDAIVQKMLPGLQKPDSSTPVSNYYAPQGVNAVVGMGNNAAVQAQFDMLDESRKQTTLLQQIAGGSSYTAPDFTKPSVAAPSRSYLLTK